MFERPSASHKGYVQMLCTLSLWKTPALPKVSYGKLLSQDYCLSDASLTGWSAVLGGRPAHGLWEGHHLIWHINCLEMRAVFLAWKY